MASRDQGIEPERDSFKQRRNGPIRSFRDFVAWQKAYALGLEIYKLSGELPERERFGLTQQLRRAVVSIASNIAEGYGRGGRADYLRFLKFARGSLYEVDTQLMYCVDLECVSAEDYADTKSILDETERVLAGLIRSLDAV